MKAYRVIDAHCDTAGKLLDTNARLSDNECHYSLKKISGYESFVQFFAAWVAKEEKEPCRRAMKMLSYLKQEIAANKDAIEEIQTVETLESVLRCGKHGAILALEDGRSLEGNIENLYQFYNMGVRAIALAWNDDNELTDGIASNRGNGLTAFGRQVVQEMNRLGMIVDVSHITEKGFWDVLELSQKPVMASHSNCRALCSHRRNLEDKQVKTLIENKGFIGINLYCDFLTDNGEATIDNILSHIEHILSLDGENAIGLGSDFDGMDHLPVGINHAGDYIALFEKMQKIGYSDDLIDKISYKNMLNFIKRIEK